MKKIALFVALVVIFGGLYAFAYFSNSKSINASSNGSSVSHVCECEDPEQCKAEGTCDGECEETTKGGNVGGCGSNNSKPATCSPYPAPYSPSSCASQCGNQKGDR